MKFAYRAYDRAGKAIAAVAEAPGLAEARESLRRQGLFVAEIAESGGAAPAPAGAAAVPIRSEAAPRSKGGRSGGGRLRDLAAFLRHLSVLVPTGTPLVEAILVLERQLPAGTWRTVVADVRHRVEEGAQLSDAMEQHPAFFSPVCRSLVAAGESRGTLAEMLGRIASLTRQQLAVRSAIGGAMVYPAVLISIAVIVVATMVFFVMPRFEGLFESLGASLPPTTRFLMALGHGLRSGWMFIVPALVGAGLGLRWWLRTAAGQEALHTAFARAPVLGRITRSILTARVARVLGVLVEGKVPLVEALRLTRHAAGNILYARMIAAAEEAVSKGQPVAESLERAGLLNPSVLEAIRSGERTGQLATVLLHVADFLDEDNELVVKSLTSIIEPLILAALGVVVGFVAISMFMPLFDLAGSGGGAGAPS